MRVYLVVLRQRGGLLQQLAQPRDEQLVPLEGARRSHGGLVPQLSSSLRRLGQRAAQGLPPVLVGGPKAMLGGERAGKPHHRNNTEKESASKCLRVERVW